MLQCLCGVLAFGLELWTPRHLAGFAVMTLVTAGAAASFALVLAALWYGIVPLAASLTPIGALILGEVLAECDLPEGAFYMVGKIEDAVEKAKEMAAAA